MVLTLLSSRLRLFCFRKRQGQRSNSLINKRLALIDILTIPHTIRPIADQPRRLLGFRSGTRFLCIAPQIGNPVAQLRATALIAFGFSEGEREFQLLELMTTFKET